MPKKLRWGVLSTANIGLKKVLPAMQLGRYTSVDAIASRDLNKARDAAAELGILKAYGSYEELLADPEIDAIYNPLPNHLHVPWTIKAALAGKHVLCEKPAREREEIAQVSRILRRIKALKVVAVLSHQSAALDTQLHGVGRQQPGDISFGEEGVRSLQRKLLGALDVHLDERRRGMSGRNEFIKRHGGHHVRFFRANPPAIEAHQSRAIGDSCLHHGHVADVVQFEVSPQEIYTARRRFKCEDVSGLADETREGQRIEPNIRSNVVGDASRFDNARKSYRVICFVVSQPASVRWPGTGYPPRAFVDASEHAHNAVVGHES